MTTCKKMPRSRFAEYLDEDHFAGLSSLPDDGEAWCDLFAINTLRRTATLTCTTGCLPLHITNAAYRHNLTTIANEDTEPSPSVPTSKPVDSSSAKKAKLTPSPPPRQQQQQQKSAKKRPSQYSTQVYQTSSAIDASLPITTTRSGRQSKRPQNILILEASSKE